MLRLASWPGREHKGNDVIGVLLEALRREGVVVHDLAGRIRAPEGGVDVLLAHWAERPFWGRPGPLLTAGRAVRTLREIDRLRPRTKIVWMVHNLRPHEGGWPARLIWPAYVRRFARRVDGWVALSPGTIEPIRAALPELADKPSGHVWHPAYPVEAATEAERAAARAAHGLDPEAVVVGYCGKIRPYKGVEELADAFSAWSGPSARLLLAGEAGDGRLAERLERRAAADRRIRLDLRALPAEDFRRVLIAADLVAAPFRDYLHSGAIVHALSAGRRVLTPDTPFAASLRALAPDRVETYRGALTAERLALAAAGRTPPEPPDLAALSPQAGARALLAFCVERLGAGR